MLLSLLALPVESQPVEVPQLVSPPVCPQLLHAHLEGLHGAETLRDVIELHAEVAESVQDLHLAPGVQLTVAHLLHWVVLLVQKLASPDKVES